MEWSEAPKGHLWVDLTADKRDEMKVAMTADLMDETKAVQLVGSRVVRLVVQMADESAELMVACSDLMTAGLWEICTPKKW